MEGNSERRTPHKVIYSKKPDVGHFGTFGCREYVLKTRHRTAGKFDSRAEEGMQNGYCHGEAFRILTKNGKRIIESMNVTYEEECHSTISHENDQVIKLDLTDPKMFLDDSKIGQDEIGPDIDVRQTETTDYVSFER